MQIPMTTNPLNLRKILRRPLLAVIPCALLTFTIAAPLNEQMAFCKDQVESQFFHQGSYEKTKAYNACMSNADRLIQEYEKNKILRAEQRRLDNEKREKRDRDQALENQRRLKFEEMNKGPSESYGSRIRARIKPNIVFSNQVESLITADVEVRCAPDGTIIGKKIIKSSGNDAWDNAVLKAIDKTETLPLDLNGRTYSPMVMSFSIGE